ncbi:MAG: primase-helicase zinc-binding domain-containing protein, partial [Desulfobacterales bacterium]|nr:primase-helicase zinc-binding domain-containing protein [Desulfobacterales bacterium]
MNVLELAQVKVELKKVASTHGGEYQGPCPGCGGEDRFHVWPEKNDGQGSYWCRGCEKSGDNIQFLRDFEGLSFREACDRLDVTVPDHRALYVPVSHSRKEFEPSDYEPPSDIWQERAEKLTAWAHKNLIKNVEIINWLAKRGIKEKTAIRYRLGWNPGENGKDIYRARKAWGLPKIMNSQGRPRAVWIPVGLVIPCISNNIIYRIRIRRPEGSNPTDPRYYVIPGSSMKTMLLEANRQVFVIVESELDAFLVSQYEQAGAMAVGSATAKPDSEAYNILKKCLQILVSLDFDSAGAKAINWWKESFLNCIRWPVSVGKDPGEAYQLGMDFEKWLKAGMPPAMVIKNGKGRNMETKKQKPKIKNQRPENTDLPETVIELQKLL